MLLIKTEENLDYVEIQLRNHKNKIFIRCISKVHVLLFVTYKILGFLNQKRINNNIMSSLQGLNIITP